MNVLVFSGDNHRFADCASVILEFLEAERNLSVESSDDKGIFVSSQLEKFDVCVFGTGFTRQVRHSDNTWTMEQELTPRQEAGLFEFVSGGKGLVGVHGTAWKVGSRVVDLIGGHANWHPPGGTFRVHIEDPSHPATQGIADFELEDEIYISAYDPDLHILATAEWSDHDHPLAWVKTYGEGRVFYTTLGHGPATFEQLGMQKLIQGLGWAAKG